MDRYGRGAGTARLQAHGPTHESALAQAKEAMALWIESARAEGQPRALAQEQVTAGRLSVVVPNA